VCCLETDHFLTQRFSRERAIPDIFKTITNLTGDMSAAAILSRT
jgi:hypothetical protein